MKSNLLMDFSVDKKNNRINVKREFEAPVSKVWSAWTESELLDRWWAPRPWKARTKTMDFREGGHWLYAMIGPEGEEHWSRADYKSVAPLQSFSARDAFCDEEGKINTEFPRSEWKVNFKETGRSTTVKVELTFDTLADLEKNMEMGFKEGFTAAFENLDELFKKR